jgi:hypothetical protein
MFVLNFYWAPTPAIFRRLISRKKSAVAEDDGTTRTLPEALKLAPDCDSFGTINRFLAANLVFRSALVETFDDDWKSSGCSLSVERLTFYFRSPPPVPSVERPYAMKLSTSDERWRKIG